jgi:hypothetical protein
MTRSDISDIYESLGRDREAVLRFLLDDGGAPAPVPAPPAPPARSAVPPAARRVPPPVAVAPAPAPAPAVRRRVLPEPRRAAPAPPVQRAEDDEPVDEATAQLLAMFPRLPRQLVERLVRHAGSHDLAVEALLELGEARFRPPSPLVASGG